MAAYRIYFTGSNDSILARHDFEAENDAAAIRIAGALLGACSDRCLGVELWQGTRKIPARLPHRSLGLADLSDEHQQVAIKTEEMIVAAEGTIARSRRLIEQLELAKQRRKGEA